MAIDPDLIPIHEEFDRRIDSVGQQVTGVSTRVDGVAQRTTTLEEMISRLEQTPGTPGGIKAPAIIVAAANSHQAIKARADVVCTGTGDAAAINRITEPVQLVDGCYLLESPLLIQRRGHRITGWSWATVAMKAKTFTNAGKGATPALVKVADTAAGQEACAVQVSDIYFHGRFRADFGEGAASGSPVAGIWLEIGGQSHNDPAIYGLPLGGPDGSDNWSGLRHLRVVDTTTGIYVANTDGARGFEYSDIGIARLQAGGAGLHIAASDARVDNVSAASGGAANSTGILINGGNALVSSVKAFFFNQTGAVGIHIASSRCSLAGVWEAQDNRVGVKVTGGDAHITGGRIDNMNAGMDVGLDLSAAPNPTVYGVRVQNRGTGSYKTGIAMPIGTGVVDGYVDAAIAGGITSPVTAVPAGVEARVTVKRASGMTTVRRELPNG